MKFHERKRVAKNSESPKELRDLWLLGNKGNTINALIACNPYAPADTILEIAQFYLAGPDKEFSYEIQLGLLTQPHLPLDLAEQIVVKKHECGPEHSWAGCHRYHNRDVLSQKRLYLACFNLNLTRKEWEAGIEKNAAAGYHALRVERFVAARVEYLILQMTCDNSTSRIAKYMLAGRKPVWEQERLERLNKLVKSAP